MSEALPNAEHMERAIISAMFPDQAAAVVAFLSDLTPRHFYAPFTRELWEEIISRVADGKPTDAAMLIQWLASNGKSDFVSELAAILASGGVASRDKLTEYANALRETFRQRELWITGRDLQTAALNPAAINNARETAVQRLNDCAGSIEGKRRLTLKDLDARRIKAESPPPRPVPVFTLQGQQICTAGNLTVLSAQVKSGKSAAVGALLAASLAADAGNDTADTFSFAGRATGGKAVIHFDTEQSPHDAWSLVDRACRRAGVATMPSNYRAYSLCDIPTAKRREFLAAEMARAAVECGGIHAVTIDGIADLICDPNAPDEAFGLCEELGQLAVLHDCPIISVLHENPSVNGVSKTRGHLGSQLERKAESNLRLVKKGEVSTIFSDKCRSASLPESRGAKFAWCDQEGMHVTVEEETADRKREKRKSAEAEPCNEAFSGTVGSVPHGQLRKRVEEVCGVKSRTAEKRICEWLELGLIQKSTQRGYVKL